MATPYGMYGGPIPPGAPPMGMGPSAPQSGHAAMMAVSQAGAMVPTSQGTMASHMDPSMNNQPLQFNMGKGKAPMPIPGKPEDGKTDDKDGYLAAGSTADTQEGNLNSGMGGPMGPMGGQMTPWASMMGPMTMDPMMMGPMGFNQYGYMGPMGPMPEGPIQKEVLKFKDAVLYPPPPNAPPMSTRERPPGCRTIFVGGLPENMKEESLREIFEGCGPICSIRMSKKNFAHIRFESLESVDQAVYISGYRIKLDNMDDKPNTGRVHVDYAQARDDLYEWECSQRMLARENRHRQRVEEARLRPPSPPPVIHYSDHEASALLEKLKGDDTFIQASQVLSTWLERGDCNRRSANTFYSMIQSTNSHVRRLMNEKAQHDQELEQMKLKFRQRLEGILRQFEQISQVFGTASKQKAWDHFSKAQRKNLEVWRKQCKEIMEAQQEEFLGEREEAEMDLSDGDAESIEGPPVVKKKKIEAYDSGTLAEWQNSQLKEENDSLKCQLEAYKNEVDLLKQEASNSGEMKDRQLKALQQALQGMQQQLIASKQQLKSDEEEIRELKQAKLKAAVTEVVTTVTAAGDEKTEVANGGDDTVLLLGPATDDNKTQVDSSAPIYITSSSMTEREARIIALLATFLNVHPFGASLDYIWSYLQRCEIRTRSSELEDLMEKYSSLFRQDLHGIGASLEKRWLFTGYPTSVVAILS